MKNKSRKNLLIILPVSAIIVIGILIFIAFARTWGKTELEFKIHINEELVLESVYGESPTFAIWLENPETGAVKTIFVTNRAAMGDWEGKAEVPAALPKWDKVKEQENQARSKVNDELPETDAISGATPKPGYFITRVNVEPGSEWICWIEMNLSGDFNDNYKQFDEVTKKTDEYGTGQPALIYRGKITADQGVTLKPEVVGMSIYNSVEGQIIKPVWGITTALNVFDEIQISAVKPKPRIINKY